MRYVADDILQDDCVVESAMCPEAFSSFTMFAKVEEHALQLHTTTVHAPSPTLGLSTIYLQPDPGPIRMDSPYRNVPH